MSERYQPVPPKTGTLKKHEKFKTPNKYESVMIPDLRNREVICGWPPRCGKSIMMKEKLNKLKKEGKKVLIVDKQGTRVHGDDFVKETGKFYPKQYCFKCPFWSKLHYKRIECLEQENKELKDIIEGLNDLLEDKVTVYPNPCTGCKYKKESFEKILLDKEHCNFCDVPYILLARINKAYDFDVHGGSNKND